MMETSKDKVWVPVFHRMNNNNPGADKIFLCLQATKFVLATSNSLISNGTEIFLKNKQLSIAQYGTYVAAMAKLPSL